MSHVLFLMFLTLKSYAVTTENDLTRANLTIEDSYIDSRGVTLLKFKYKDPSGPTPNPAFLGNRNFTCYKERCYQLDTRGDSVSHFTNGSISKINTKFEISNDKYATWEVDNEKGEASYECSDSEKKLRQMSAKEIQELSKGIHSGKIIVESLPTESRKPVHYYEDQDKNIIVIDRTKYFVEGTYRFFEGKAQDLKEVKVKKFHEAIPGSVSLELEDGREIGAGKSYPTIKVGKNIYNYTSAYFADFSKILMPDAELYDLKLHTPCSIAITAQTENCINAQECKDSVQMNDVSRNHSKPNQNQIGIESSTSSVKDK